jgi:hypothetical protein
MSCLVDFAETFAHGASFLSGFDVVGPDNAESTIQDAREDESIVNKGFQALSESNYNYNSDFAEGEGEYFDSFDAGGEGVSQDVDSEVSESDDITVETFGEGSFVLEFFNDGIETFSEFTGGEDNIVIKGISENTDVDYNEQSGTLSVNGKEIVQLDFNLNQDDNYEIF